jgi:hypothetical protein
MAEFNKIHCNGYGPQNMITWNVWSNLNEEVRNKRFDGKDNLGYPKLDGRMKNDIFCDVTPRGSRKNR